MKAIRIHEFGGAEQLRLDDIAKPQPNGDEVLIRTAAAGINYADTMLRAGKYLFRPPLPFTLGFEVAGTVEAVGENVGGWQAGQRVLAMMRGGAYAEYAVANAAQVVPIPEGLSFGEATALLVQGLTACALLRDLRGGDTVLIHAAAGGVGSLLVQLAKQRGATVIGTASGADKLKKVTELGADASINYTEPDWTEQVLSETEGKGVDLIIEMVGGEIGRRNFECLATKGTMIVYGAASGEDFQVSALSLLAKMQTVKGYNLNLESAANIGGHTQALQENIAAGNLKITVMEFPLEQAAEAHRAIENRKTTGKVVLTV